MQATSMNGPTDFGNEVRGRGYCEFLPASFPSAAKACHVWARKICTRPITQHMQAGAAGLAGNLSHGQPITQPPSESVLSELCVESRKRLRPLRAEL